MRRSLPNINIEKTYFTTVVEDQCYSVFKVRELHELSELPAENKTLHTSKRDRRVKRVITTREENVNTQRQTEARHCSDQWPDTPVVLPVVYFCMEPHKHYRPHSVGGANTGARIVSIDIIHRCPQLNKIRHVWLSRTNLLYLHMEITCSSAYIVYNVNLPLEKWYTYFQYYGCLKLNNLMYFASHGTIFRRENLTRFPLSTTGCAILEGVTYQTSPCYQS